MIAAQHIQGPTEQEMISNDGPATSIANMRANSAVELRHADLAAEILWREGPLLVRTPIA